MSKFEGRNSRAAKLSQAVVDQIRKEYAEGATQSSLSRAYRISIGQIGRIVRLESWIPREPVRPTDRGIEESLERLRHVQQAVDVGGPSALEKMQESMGTRSGDSLIDELRGISSGKEDPVG